MIIAPFHLLRGILLPAVTLLLLASAAQAQIAADAQQSSTAPTPTPPPAANVNDMPSWSEFPLAPTNVPTAADIRVRVSDANAKRQQLRTEIRALVWDNNNPEAFAADALNRIDPNFSKAIEGQMSPADIDAWANGLRRRAAPPPIAN